MVIVWIAMAAGVLIILALIIKLCRTKSHEVVGAGIFCKRCGYKTNGLKCPRCGKGDRRRRNWV